MTALLKSNKGKFHKLDLIIPINHVSNAEYCFHNFRNANEADEERDLYLGEYVYHLGQCFKAIHPHLHMMRVEELTVLNSFTEVVERHLDQIKFEKISTEDVAYLNWARRKVGDLATQFRNEINLQEFALSNHVLRIADTHPSTYSKTKFDQSDMDSPEID